MGQRAFRFVPHRMTRRKVRLLLHLAGLYAAVLILRRAFSARQAIVPLLVLGLSPALIYFDTLQTSYGVDVWYGAICLALVLSIRPWSATRADRLKAAAVRLGEALRELRRGPVATSV